jgi:transglutaminase-like putative cysteine protease
MSSSIAFARFLALSSVCAMIPFAQGRAEPSSAAAMTVEPELLKPGGERSFSVEYVGQITGIPSGTKELRVWIPVPQTTTAQTIRELEFSSEPRLETEPKYGNRIASWTIANPESSVAITMRFDCTRRETVVNLESLKKEGKDPKDAYAVYRGEDALVVIDDEVRSIAGEVCKGKKGTVEKAHAIYDYVLSKMTYDKSGKGWGTGSTKFACEVGKGNCTDFHALFNSLCRAEGIASGFEIGLYLPYEAGKQEAPGGYHCWAFFRVPGKTWVPVDCSEADRFPERASYFFGGHTPNRVTLSTGRDIDLAPRQAGPALNYFLNPYAEADGTPVPATKTWTFHELS